MPEFELNVPPITPPKPADFKPGATYSHVGDLLKVYLEDEPAYAVQLTPLLTVLRAFKDHRIVGVKVAGILEMVKG